MAFFSSFLQNNRNNCVCAYQLHYRISLDAKTIGKHKKTNVDNNIRNHNNNAHDHTFTTKKF